MTAQPDSQFHRPPTAQEAIKEELLRRITIGVIGLGDALRQEVIARDLGVSPAPVREALKELVGMGVITYQGRQGHRLREFNTTELREVYEYRQLLESALARAAAMNVDDALLTRLDAEVSLMEQLDADAQLFDLREANKRFHFTIYAAAQKPYFLEQCENAWRRTLPYRSLLYNPTHERGRLHTEHRAMTDALAQCDAEGLIHLQNEHRRAALAHIEAIISRLRAPHASDQA